LPPFWGGGGGLGGGGPGGGAAKASLRERSVMSAPGKGAASARLLPRIRRRVEVEKCMITRGSCFGMAFQKYNLEKSRLLNQTN
jgi:hypothetical protein